MERSEITGLPFAIRAHPGFEGDAAVCGVGITKLAHNTVRRRHQQKRKSPDKPKPDEVKEMVVGAGSKENGMGLPFAIRAHPGFEGDAAVCGVGITKLLPNTVLRRHRQKRKSPDKPDEVKEMVVGAGSKEDGMVQPAKKLAKLGLSKELMEYIRTREVMGIMATETPRPSLVPIPQEELFDCELKEQIAAEYNENREFDAYVLYQYRTKGYAEIFYDSEL